MRHVETASELVRFSFCDQTPFRQAFSLSYVFYALYISPRLLQIVSHVDAVREAVSEVSEHRLQRRHDTVGELSLYHEVCSGKEERGLRQERMHAVYDACRGGYADIARTRIIVLDLGSVPVREEHPLKAAGLDRIYGIESVQYRGVHHSGAGSIAPGLHGDAVLHAQRYDHVYDLYHNAHKRYFPVVAEHEHEVYGSHHDIEETRNYRPYQRQIEFRIVLHSLYQLTGFILLEEDHRLHQDLPEQPRARTRRNCICRPVYEQRLDHVDQSRGHQDDTHRDHEKSVQRVFI